MKDQTMERGAERLDAGEKAGFKKKKNKGGSVLEEANRISQ